MPTEDLERRLYDLADQLAKERRARLEISIICLKAGATGSDTGAISAVTELARQSEHSRMLLNVIAEAIGHPPLKPGEPGEPIIIALKTMLVFLRGRNQELERQLRAREIREERIRSHAHV